MYIMNNELRLAAHELTYGHELNLRFVNCPSGICRNSIHGAKREITAKPIHDGEAVKS